jgi:hypothetical protein
MNANVIVRVLARVIVRVLANVIVVRGLSVWGVFETLLVRVPLLVLTLMMLMMLMMVKLKLMMMKMVWVLVLVPVLGLPLQLQMVVNQTPEIRPPAPHHLPLVDTQNQSRPLCTSGPPRIRLFLLERLQLDHIFEILKGYLEYGQGLNFFSSTCDLFYV